MKTTKDENRKKIGRYPHHQNVHRDIRTEMMARMTAALTHELNQPLGAILTNAEAARQMLGDQNPDLREITAAIDDIIRDNSRAVNVVQSIRALFQGESIEMTSLDIREVLDDVGGIARQDAAQKRIAMHIDTSAVPMTVVGNKAQLIQALLNLVLNAFDAMCDSDEHAREITFSARRLEFDRVRVTVRDTGSGIDPEAIPRVFDPFFTTKPKGMGMGLAIVLSIVQNHGGRIWATRNSDRGLTMEIDLPAA